MKLIIAWVCALAVVAIAVPAQAHGRSHHHRHHWKHGQHKDHSRPARVRYGGRPGLGHWRPGPETGYGFRFSTYKGDPFGSDDYWDGGRCYYRGHRDFCVANKIFDGSDLFFHRRR